MRLFRGGQAQKARQTERNRATGKKEMIRVENLVKRYGTNYALDDISFEINDYGVPLPVAVELTASQRSEEVHRSVREDLGIAEENIRWRIG